MASKEASLKIVSYVTVIMTMLAATVWMSERQSITIEVKCNGTNITWNETTLDKKTMQYKEMALAVRSLLKKDLENVTGVTDFKVKKFLKIHKNPGTFCEFEFKSDLGKERVENELDNALDICMEKASILNLRQNMSLLLPGVEWKDPFADYNNSEYRRIKTAIEDALNEFYQDKDDVVDFEVVSLAKANDGWTLAKVEYYLLVSSATNATGKELQDTLTTFTKSDTYEKTFPDAKRIHEKRNTATESSEMDKENERSKLTISLIVVAAITICAVMILFLIVVIRQNWKYIKEHAPEVKFELYRKRRSRTKNLPEKIQKEETKTTPVSSEDCIVVLNSYDNPVSSES